MPSRTCVEFKDFSYVKLYVTVGILKPQILHSEMCRSYFELMKVGFQKDAVTTRIYTRKGRDEQVKQIFGGQTCYQNQHCKMLKIYNKRAYLTSTV